MAREMPPRDRAILDIRKLGDYCLNPSHSRGRHKARVFRDSLGLRRADAGWLRDLLLEAFRSEEPSREQLDRWGTRWHLDVNVARQGKSAVVRTIWIVRSGEAVPKFVTCWVLR
jgi:hypothetical protein